ncbi:MAG: hypothetical protein J6X18_01045 [Bacteroidales bacterium]|nr:hypothetical protein [Bacteroidales bacterium]
MEEQMRKIILDLAQDCKDKGLNTAKQVKKNVFDNLWANYKGKAPKWRVEAICDDLTESVCLEMGIPHDC